MGYSYYTLPDGREAGYGVEAECDHPDCHETIDRGLGYLCGRNPLGHKDAEEPGCGNYYCSKHEYDHGCSSAECGKYEGHGDGYCGLIADHEPPHRDAHDGHEFAVIEDDLVNDDGMIEVRQ